MLRRWLAQRQRSAAQARAADMQAWLDCVDRLTTACTESLQPLQIPPDIGVVLDRVDRELMRFRNEYDRTRGPLRRHAPSLVDPVSRATERVYRLRNDACAYLLRVQDVRLAEQAGAWPQSAEQERDRARGRALQTAHELAAEMDTLAPELRILIARWSSPTD